MDKTILIERTSKRLKRWEFIITAALFLTLIAGFGTLYIAIPLAIAIWGGPDCAFLPSSPSESQSGGITDECTSSSSNRLIIR